MSVEKLSNFMRRTMQEESASTPLYHRLMSAFRAAIADQVLARGSFLPSERELCSDLAVSRVTLRKAIDGLVDDGLVIRRHGSRTMVAPRYEKSISSLTGFSEDTRARGQEPGAILLSRKMVMPTSTEAIALNMTLDQQVIRIERLRTADGRALAIERATLPADVLQSVENIGESLYATLDEMGLRPVQGVQRLRASVMSEADAKLLDSQPGSPLLIMERCCLLDDGRPIEFTQTRYNGAHYEFVTQLKG